MIAIKAKIKNSYLVSISPVNLPEGVELEVTANSLDTLGDEQLTEANWPNSPEGIASLLARMDSRARLQMSETEIAQWERIRQDDKTCELSGVDDRDERLHKIWQ
jgi:hypothetical protein